MIFRKYRGIAEYRVNVRFHGDDGKGYEFFFFFWYDPCDHENNLYSAIMKEIEPQMNRKFGGFEEQINKISINWEKTR